MGIAEDPEPDPQVLQSALPLLRPHARMARCPRRTRGGGREPSKSEVRSPKSEVRNRTNGGTGPRRSRRSSVGSCEVRMRSRSPSERFLIPRSSAALRRHPSLHPHRPLGPRRAAPGPQPVPGRRRPAGDGLSRIGLVREDRPATGLETRTGARTERAPSQSGQPEWLVAGEIVETTRSFGRTMAAIDPAWVIELAPHLIRTTHDHVRWDATSGRVLARERVRLRGLVLRERTVGYGRVNPAEATEIFIRAALVGEELLPVGRALRRPPAAPESPSAGGARLRPSRPVEGLELARPQPRPTSAASARPALASSTTTAGCARRSKCGKRASPTGSSPISTRRFTSSTPRASPTSVRGTT